MTWRRTDNWVKRPNRDTYLNGEQMLGRVINSSDQISCFLTHLQTLTDDPRTKIHIDQLVKLQNELTSSIAGYRENAPHEVQTTYFQYVEPGNGRLEEMMDEHRQFTSLNDVTSTALALNEELAQQLENVSINEGIEHAREATEGLQDLVRETCRKISLARAGADDM